MERDKDSDFDLLSTLYKNAVRANAAQRQAIVLGAIEQIAATSEAHAATQGAAHSQLVERIEVEDLSIEAVEQERPASTAKAP